MVFLDLRGFTAFAETAEPEEVMGVLREYHAEMGRLILAHEGTLERFTGDGMMVFFNDPVPVPDAPERAVRMAVAMRERVGELAAEWRKRGYELDLGLGIAQGYATHRRDRLRGAAGTTAPSARSPTSPRACAARRKRRPDPRRRRASWRRVEALVDSEPLGELSLKGFSRPVPAFSVTRLRG